LKQHEHPEKKPFVSFIIPVYNGEKYLAQCLESIRSQTYPDDKIEIIVVDGGSTDTSIGISERHRAIILHNEYRLAEKGKAIGIRAARGDIIALIDADNEIVQADWLDAMVRTLNRDQSIIGIESNWLMKKDYSLANRYCCLIRLEDPISRRFAFLANCADKEDRGDHVVYTIRKGRFPALGANGFLWRRDAFDRVPVEESYDEHDFSAALFNLSLNRIANLKGYGIYHYHADTLWDFFRKRMRQPHLFWERKSRKKTVWLDHYGKGDFLKAVCFCTSILGPLFEAVNGYKQTREKAWFLHPLLSLATVVIYTVVTLKIMLVEIANKPYALEEKVKNGCM